MSKMSLEEVERRLRTWCRSATVEYEVHEHTTMADAIRAHLRECHKHKGCVSADDVREILDWAHQSEKAERDTPAKHAYHSCEAMIATLLPPEPDPLDEAIAMVRENPSSGYQSADVLLNRNDLLALLRKAREAKR